MASQVDLLRSLAMEFNRLPAIEEQVQAVDQAILHQMGLLFIKHDVQQKYGVSLLHRHQRIQPGAGLVHAQTSNHEDICTMRPLDLSVVKPHTMCLGTQDVFVPLEYTLIGTPFTETDFMSELATLLRSTYHQGILGITTLPAVDGLWLEQELPKHGGTVAQRIDPHFEHELMADCVPTAWRFTADGEGTKVHVLRGCKTDDSGGHVVRDEQS